MLAEVEITLQDDRWSGLQGLAQTAADTVAAHVQAAICVSVLGCDDARITELNAEFRDKDTPTNVLSWPSEALTPGDMPRDPEVGDIAISYDTCAREADAQGKPFDDHVTHLLIHGTLHLLGYDHETDAQAAQMEGLETALLAKLGMDDPYVDQGAP